MGLGLCLPALARSGESSSAAARASAAPKFELDVMPVLTAAGCNQGACHGKSRGQNGFALSLLGFDADSDFAAVVQQARGRRISPAAPEASLLLQKPTGEVPHGGGVRFSVDSRLYGIVRSWIAAGTPRSAATDPELQGIDVAPPESPLTPNETRQLTVTAHYTDGSTRDVTELCAYQASEAAVAAISPSGQIRAGNLPGETSLMVRYMGHILTWNAVIPRAQRLPADRYASLPRQNFIDDLVYRKLEQIVVLPTAPAADSTFLRRAHLDLIGRLPTVDEARRFLDDPSPHKRAQLVDALLDRPEYADHWANKWADLLRPNPYHVGMKATLNFDAWIRDQFRRNVPYDQFVRELLTATGSTWHNGAATLWRDRRSPEEIAPMISQLFLGVRLDCARCHHHPFEVWGQDDFYGMAAYFARVGRKGQGISAPISGGEETIYSAAKGSVTHPLSGKEVAPRPLVGSAPVADDEDPRAALARWLTADDNPFFARAAANRIWAEVMGRGLVDPVDDMRATNPPSNPALLDALAAEFRRLRYDTKALLRTILTAHVYGLSSLPNETNLADTQNYSRHYRVRLRAETVLDAVCDITGEREAFAAMPPGSRAVELWTHRVPSVTLDTFGRPDPNLDPPCQRTGETTMVQALHLINSNQLQRKITAAKALPARLAASDKPASGIIEELYLAVFSRRPTPAELGDLVPLFGDGSPAGDSQLRRSMTEDLLWSLLNSAEFVFND